MASAPASLAAWTIRTAASYCWPWLADSSAMMYVGWPAPIWRPAIENGAVMGWSPRGGREGRGGRGDQGRREGGKVVDGEVGIGGRVDVHAAPAALVGETAGADRREPRGPGADEVLARIVADVRRLRGFHAEEQARDREADGRGLAQPGPQLVGVHDDVEPLAEAADPLELPALDAAGAVGHESRGEARAARRVEEVEGTRKGVHRAVAGPVREDTRRQEGRIFPHAMLREQGVEQASPAVRVVQLPQAVREPRRLGTEARAEELRHRAEAAVDELVLGVQGVVEVEQ